MFDFEVSMIFQFSRRSLNKFVFLLLKIRTHKSWTKFFIWWLHSMWESFCLVESWGYCWTEITQSNFFLRLLIESWWKKGLYFFIFKWLLWFLQHHIFGFLCIFYINRKQSIFSLRFLSIFLWCFYQLRATKNRIHQQIS